MTNKEKAIQWAAEKIKENKLTEPIRINAWEIIQNPILYLQTNVQRMQYASEREQQIAYLRIRTLKHNL